MIKLVVAKVIAWIILIMVVYLIGIILNYFKNRNKSSENFAIPEGNYPTYEELQQGFIDSTIILDEEYLKSIFPVLPSGIILLPDFKSFDKILYSGMSPEERGRYESID